MTNNTCVDPYPRVADSTKRKREQSKRNTVKHKRVRMGVKQSTNRTVNREQELLGGNFVVVTTGEHFPGTKFVHSNHSLSKSNIACPVSCLPLRLKKIKYAVPFSRRSKVLAAMVQVIADEGEQQVDLTDTEVSPARVQTETTAQTETTEHSKSYSSSESEEESGGGKVTPHVKQAMKVVKEKAAED